MGNQNYLLTYEYTEDDRKTRITYAWFETEENLIEFVEQAKQSLFEFEVCDAIEITGCNEIII